MQGEMPENTQDFGMLGGCWVYFMRGGHFDDLSDLEYNCLMSAEKSNIDRVHGRPSSIKY
jgi:hypothetical protein